MQVLTKQFFQLKLRTLCMQGQMELKESGAIHYCVYITYS